MKLQVPFVQLPLAFDVERMAAEVDAFAESAWKPHPQGYEGNSALSLVAANGDPASDVNAGPMRPTPHLLSSPYLMQVLETIGAVWGGTRLMRLSGNAEVTPHADLSYYWRERMRVHVPILTQPTVRFICGDAEVNMRAGECWIFDTWRIHRVINDATRHRIHLVADTVGGARFWQHASRARVPERPIPGWQPQFVAPRADPARTLAYESVNVPTVMTPWELRDHIAFLLGEAQPHPQLPALQQAAARFGSLWLAVWSQYGESRDGWNEYRAILDAFGEEMSTLGADVRVRNGNRLPIALSALLSRSALADRGRDTSAEVRATVHAQAAPTAPVTASPRAPTDLRFDRPIFIVSSPRAGSTLLFETLARARGVYTIGDESHAHIEGIEALHPAARGYASNRLDASDAGAAVIAALRERFGTSLRDAAGQPPPAGGRVRLLEKTPKNALRVPFLARAFDDARFVFLHRDPREVLSSMLEAWQSGRFVTYPELPGWQGPSWSLLLTPDWRALVGKPLIEIVARQWETATRILLDDLERVPRAQVCAIDYAALVADPNHEIRRLCDALALSDGIDLPAQLPLSRFTLTVPQADKWRRHEAEIDGVLPTIEATWRRAERFLATFAGDTANRSAH